MSADFTGHGSQNDAHRFSTDPINNAIAEGYNFPVKEVILKAFSGIKGLKFKFFLSGIIILLVFFALFFLMAQLIPMPASIYRMDFRYAASDLLVMSVSLWGIYIVLSLVSMIFTGGMTLIVMRHIRQEDNPLIPGLFGFFPDAGRVFMVWLLWSIFTLIIPYGLAYLMRYSHNETLQVIISITILIVILGISLLYSFVFYIMADNPGMGFWQVMESSRKLVMGRLLKLVIFYIVFMILIYILFVVFFFVIVFVMQLLMGGMNPFMITQGQMFLYMLIPYLLLFIVSLWILPFIWLVHSMIYMYLLNDPSVRKEALF